MREFASIIVLKKLDIDDASALTFSIAIGALSTLATLLNSAFCLLLKQAAPTVPRNDPLQASSLSITRISAYVLGATTAVFVLFQVNATFEETTLNLNLADPFAIFAFASVFIPILTLRELPQWEIK